MRFRKLLVALSALVALSSIALPELNGSNDQAEAATVYSYADLPFSCGTIVSRATTYDQTVVDGQTLYHGKSLDFPASAGITVVAPASGRVQVRSSGGYGNYVDVIEPNGMVHRHAHLLSDGLIGDGANVNKGQAIGRVGSTGYSTGPHLHYERLINGSQVDIVLDGPSLQWSQKSGSDGDRYTTHRLKSVNCPESKPVQFDSRSDVLAWSNGNLIGSRSNGRSGSAWQTVLNGISNPSSTDACQFSSDLQGEFISYEAHLNQFVMGEMTNEGRLWWRVIKTGVSGITDFICVDWNGDSNQDIWARHSSGAIYVGVSDGRKIRRWNRLRDMSGAWAKLGDPEFLEACDLNGDGRQEVISYEANRRFMVGRPSGATHLRWDFLLDGIYNIDATACGDFNPGHRGDELIGWQIYKGKGTYLIGEFDYRLRHQRWDVLSPTGFARPFRGELDAGDIDSDGRAELLVHEHRNGMHYVMVADFTSSRRFNWYQYLRSGYFEDMVVGRFL